MSGMRSKKGKQLQPQSVRNDPEEINSFVQLRMAGFYLVSVLVGGFSSILAYYIMKMEGVQGLRSWRWIFIIVGSPVWWKSLRILIREL